VEGLDGIFPDALRFKPDAVGQSPAARGAYLLDIRIDEPISALVGREVLVVDAGRYLYAGSAHGSGGIRGRLGHHMRKGKAPHWHIDQLTEHADRIDALAFPDGDECALVAQLLATGEWMIPIPGFGSSDCRQCAAHLLAPVT
jgi:Uri superfamily endonuclease